MKLLTCLLLVAAFSTAQNAPQLTREEAMGATGNVLNGRGWKSMKDPVWRAWFVLGAQHATVFLTGRNESSRYRPTNLTAFETVTALDHFYDEPENLQITFMDALRVVAMKTNGADPDTIGRVVAEMRRKLAAEPPK